MPTLHLEHVTSVKMFMSVPFFYRMQNDNRHGNAPLERAGEREAGPGLLARSRFVRDMPQRADLTA